MSLSIISPVSKSDEDAVQSLINSYIDNSESLVVNAGAGSGKTYALTESLKYIIKQHGEKLVHHNQNIMCITYTNVATNEIKNRLGNSSLVKVSTIHERLWSLVKGYQKELVKIHAERIREEIIRLKYDLNDNCNEKETKQFKAYRELSEALKDEFKCTIIARKSDFYKHYDKPAKEFKLALEKHLGSNSSLLSNVANFKKTVSTIYRIENYQECLTHIEAGNPKYSKVKYEDRYNDDILHRMIISHNTLLDYSLKMVRNYTLLRRVILDSYPYILIDEYQDTNKSVVQIMKLIEEHALSINRKIFVGYFGDTAQNIYEDGVGEDLTRIHSGLKVVNKQYNRRSHSEIIDVINKIRNDDIKQKSIYEDSSGGSVQFYTGSDEIKQQFIEKYKIDWNINSNNKLHCLLLLNKFVAEFNEFSDIYNAFSETSYYKINYNRLNNELLSNDLSKLGEVANLFYRILEFIGGVNDPKTSLGNLIDKKIYSRMTFLKTKELIGLLRSLQGISIGEYVQAMFSKYRNSGNNWYKQVLQRLIILERYTYQDFTNYLLDELFLSIGSEKLNNFKSKLLDMFEEELTLKVANEQNDRFMLELKQFLGGEYFSCIDAKEVQEFKSKLTAFIDSHKLFSKSSKDENLFKVKLNRVFDEEILSVIDVDEIEIAKGKLDNLLNIGLDQWTLWYDFINNDQKTDIEYHTYHGTKGAEYDNVLIIMENDFGRMNKNKFSSFFAKYSDSNTLDEEDRHNFNDTKNLLYVSCSRAIKNLRILYLDDVSDFRDGIENIFETIYSYGNSSAQK